MIHRITIAALLIAFVASEADAQSRQYRRRGVILGGLAGAAIGAAIGDKGDNETAGALIGAATGAIAGGAIGNQKDQRLDHYRRYHSPYQPSTPVPYYRHQGQRFHGGQPVPHYSQPHVYRTDPVYQPPIVTAPSVLVPNDRTVLTPSHPTTNQTVPTREAPQPVSPEHVLSMTEAGISDNIIVQQIEQRGVSHNLSVREIIHLHQSGVSEVVISAMQTPLGYGFQQPTRELEFRSGDNQ